MCGIAGYWSRAVAASDSGREILERMTRSLRHRGPDASGHWVDRAQGIALGHRRLSILDLSDGGRQPMESSCGRFVISYNGEVYNFSDLRKELEQSGHSFRSGTDTEVILEAVSLWGLEKAVKRFIGMFAFGLWDKRERTLSLCRDRLGIKPLFYSMTGDAFVFGSELKAMLAYPEMKPEINPDALAAYFRHNYVPQPHCIFRDYHKVSPGTIVTFDTNTSRVDTAAYWNLEDIWTRPSSGQRFHLDPEDAADHLEALLNDAVGRRMIADVPLGAFLSGGIDSSTVAALMQAQSSTPIKTFCIGFEDSRFNEADHARAIANHLGTDHTELVVTPDDLLESVRLVPEYWDEPFADSSQIPTLAVCAMARKDVTVSLSGDGGDELFLGYERYNWIRLWNKLSTIPLGARKLLSRAGSRLPAWAWQLIGSKGLKYRWRLSGVESRDFKAFYQYLVSHHKTPEDFVIGAKEPGTAFNAPFNMNGSIRHQAAYLDLKQYIPDDILTKLDRTSMAVSLEARVPLLDHRVVEFAASLPDDYKIRDGENKWLLRKVLERHVPRQLFEREKKGFAVPIEHWLKKELRDWCESLLDPVRLKNHGLLDVRQVRRMWNEYLDGERNWHYYIWDVLMFQAWYERWMNGR